MFVMQKMGQNRQFSPFSPKRQLFAESDWANKYGVLFPGGIVSLYGINVHIWKCKYMR